MHTTSKSFLFTSLAAFTLVAKELSFARAAAELGITPTAVSKTIKHLEVQLGTRLFNRTTRSVSLTEAGAQLLLNVAPALAQISSSIEQVRSSIEVPRGELRINTSYVAFTSLVEPHLPAFAIAYPELSVEVAIDNGLSDIVAHGFDVGIRLGHILQYDMVALPLGGRQQRVVVGSADYFAAHGVPHTPQDLLLHNCIRQRLQARGRFYDWMFQVAGKIVHLDVRGSLIFDEMRPAVRAARAGIGLAYVFRQFVEDHIQKGELKVVLETYCPLGETFYLYYPHRTQIPAKLRVFIDFIRAKHLN